MAAAWIFLWALVAIGAAEEFSLDGVDVDQVHHGGGGSGSCQAVNFCGTPTYVVRRCRNGVYAEDMDLLAAEDTEDRGHGRGGRRHYRCRYERVNCNCSATTGLSTTCQFGCFVFTTLCGVQTNLPVIANFFNATVQCLTGGTGRAMISTDEDRQFSQEILDTILNFIERVGRLLACGQASTALRQVILFALNQAAVLRNIIVAAGTLIAQVTALGSITVGTITINVAGLLGQALTTLRNVLVTTAPQFIDLVMQLVQNTASVATVQASLAQILQTLQTAVVTAVNGIQNIIRNLVLVPALAARINCISALLNTFCMTLFNVACPVQPPTITLPGLPGR